MASVLTQINPFRTSTGNTCPVILKGREGIDYIIKKFTIKAGVSIYMRSLVKIDGTNTNTIDLCGAGEKPLGIVIDSIENRKLMVSQQSTGIWNYSTAFTAGTDVDVAILINNCVVSLNLAASNAANEGLELKAAASGAAAVMATTTVRDSAGTGTTAITEGIQIGKALAKTTSGTGAQIIAAVMYA